MQLPFLILLFFVYDSSQFRLFTPKTLLKAVKPKILDLIDSSINGTACGADLKRFVDDLYSNQLWALSMLDASSKLQNGLLNGNFDSYGNYHQCLSVQNELLKGQYCTMYLIPNETLHRSLMKFILSIGENSHLHTRTKLLSTVVSRYGLCVPKSCSVTNITAVFKRIQQTTRVPFQAKIGEELCYYEGKQLPGNSMDIFVFWFFLFLVALILVSTAYDLYANQEEPSLLVSFSLYTNTRKLFDTKTKAGTLTCLYGVRVLSMVWVIVGHLTVIKGFVSTNRVDITTEWPHHLPNSIFIASPYAVDTFFGMSGLLVVYSYLQFKETYKRDAWVCFYVNRLVRLVPAIVGMILFNISFAKYFLGGPLAFKSLFEVKTNCENNWWATLFFVNNYVSLLEQCNAATWYLSVDTHLYALAPILLYGFTKNPKKTLLGILVLCLLSFTYTWMVVVKNRLGFVVYWEVDLTAASMVYLSTLCRCPAWLVGACFGYFLHRRGRSIDVSRSTNLALWVLALSTMTFLIMYQVVFFQQEYSEYRSALFNTLSRPLWAAAVCFIIVSCCTGNGGPVNSFLSHPVFIVLGKLTYSMYLMHITVLSIITYNKKEARYFSSFDIFIDFWGCFVVVVFAGSVLYMLFEAPAVSLMGRLSKSTVKKSQ